MNSYANVLLSRPLKEVRSTQLHGNHYPHELTRILDDGEDGLEEIDLNNIVEGGRRTRGQIIDFAKAAEQNPVDDDDEDDDDDDFTPPDEDTKMSG